MVAALTATGDSGGVDSDGGAFKLQTRSDCKDAAADSVVTPPVLGFGILGRCDGGDTAVRLTDVVGRLPSMRLCGSGVGLGRHDGSDGGGADSNRRQVVEVVEVVAVAVVVAVVAVEPSSCRQDPIAKMCRRLSFDTTGVGLQHSRQR